MAYQNPYRFAEVPRQLLGEIDRAVPAAGAAEGHGEVAAAVAVVAREPLGDEAADVLQHAPHLRLRFEKGYDRPIASGKRTQPLLVMRIGQAAHVEHQIGIERNAVLETEGFEQHRQPLAGAKSDKVLD